MTIQPILIETKRLVLKGYPESAVATIFQNYAKKDVIEIFGHQSNEDYEIELKKFRTGKTAFNTTYIIFQIFDSLNHSSIGRTGFHNYNIAHSRAEIGYKISNEAHKRMGYMTEAVTALIDYGFNELKLNRIEALIGTENIPSLKLIRKLNFKNEGVLRQHYFINNKYEDSMLFSKLLSEHNSEA